MAEFGAPLVIGLENEYDDAIRIESSKAPVTLNVDQTSGNLIITDAQGSYTPGSNTTSYTKAQSNANFVSATTIANYYTKAQAAADFLSATTVYCSYTNAQVNANFLSATTFIPTDFYSKAQANANFLSATTDLGYTNAQINANFLSANTSHYTQAQANANFLSANTSFYTQTQINNKLSGNTNVYFGTATATSVTSLGDITLGTAIYCYSGATLCKLVWDGAAIKVTTA